MQFVYERRYAVDEGACSAVVLSVVVRKSMDTSLLRAAPKHRRRRNARRDFLNFLKRPTAVRDNDNASPLTVRMSRCAVCLRAIAIGAWSSSSSRGSGGDYTLRINNRRRNREQTANIHSSIHPSVHPCVDRRTTSQSRTSKRSSCVHCVTSARTTSPADHVQSVG